VIIKSDFLKGKKTYITVAIGIAMGIAQGLGLPIPDWIMWALGFMGLAFHRSAISDNSAIIASALKTLYEATEKQVDSKDTKDVP
jgi:hypothetical protein